MTCKLCPRAPEQAFQRPNVIPKAPLGTYFSMEACGFTGYMCLLVLDGLKDSPRVPKRHIWIVFGVVFGRIWDRFWIHIDRWIDGSMHIYKYGRPPGERRLTGKPTQVDRPALLGEGAASPAALLDLRIGELRGRNGGETIASSDLTC